jgi:hypothetical protein
MAQTKSLKFDRPRMMANDGRAVFLGDQATLAANPTANDTMDFPVPAGFELHSLSFYVPDMDSSTGLAGKIGFYNPDGSGSTRINGADVTDDDDRFFAAAALGQSAGAVAGLMTGGSMLFEEPAYIRITWTVACPPRSVATCAASPATADRPLQLSPARSSGRWAAGPKGLALGFNQEDQHGEDPLHRRQAGATRHPPDRHRLARQG